MSIIRYNRPAAVWSPLDRMSSLRDLLDSAFQLAGTAPGLAGDTRWAPALDVFEDEENVVVEIEAAGMKKEDFDISLHEDALTVSGERKSEETRREGESFRSERFFGSFSRTVQLPNAVKADSVSATYTDGVLRITLPKAEESKPRKIQVDVK